MTNAEMFKKIFGIYAGEFWAFNAEKMQAWLASDAPTVDVVEQKELDEITEAHKRIGYDRGFRDGYAQAMEEAIKAVGANTWAGSRITQLQPVKFRKRSDDEESTKRTD